MPDIEPWCIRSQLFGTAREDANPTCHHPERDREFSPEQLSAFLLQKIERDAEAFLGEPITQAVVTVPAYFDDNQRGATQGRFAV